MKRLVEYFSGILDRPTPAAENTIDIKIELQSKLEIEKAISEMKRNMASDPDGTTQEVLLVSIEITTDSYCLTRSEKKRKSQMTRRKLTLQNSKRGETC